MQHLQWVKVPVGYMDDPRMVYLTAQKNGTFLFTFWFYLRDLAAKINDGGRIGVTPRLPIAISTFAARFHKKPAVIEQALHVLLQLELLQRTADGLLYVTMWEDMQGGGSRREATRARVARWRQRQREARNAAACPEEAEGTAAVETTATAVAAAVPNVMPVATETTVTDVAGAVPDVMPEATETTVTNAAGPVPDVMPAAAETTATAVAPAGSDVMPAAAETTATDVAHVVPDVMSAAAETTATAVAHADSDVMPATEATATDIAGAVPDVMSAAETTATAVAAAVPNVMPVAAETAATDLFGSAPAEGTPATAAPDAAAAAATGDEVTEERIIIDEDGYEVILLPPKPQRTLPQVPTGADGRPVYGDLVRSLRTESPARDTLTVYTQAFGSPNDADRRELARLGDRYGDATLQTAIGRAQRYGIGNLRYIAKIAANMRGLSYGPTGTQSKCL